MTTDQALILLLIVGVIQLNNVYLYPATTAEKMIRQKKCEPPRKRRKIYHSPRPLRQGTDSSQDFISVDVYERTGLFEDQFEELFQKINNSLHLPRNERKVNKIRRSPTTVLSARFRLLMVLHWIRDYPKLKNLSAIYGVAKSTISREIQHLLPKIYSVLKYINFPSTTPCPSNFEQVIGSIDCSAHLRYRVHPRQADYYRGDKRGFFIGAQVLVSLTGVPWRVDLTLGHNNDQGAFHLTKMRDFVEEKQIYLLADRGYSHHRLVTPDDYHPDSWNNLQKSLRSKVELVIGLTKNFSLASAVFRGTPEQQEVALIICYQLEAMMLQEYPLE